MQISTLLNLLFLTTAAQATAIRRRADIGGYAGGSALAGLGLHLDDIGNSLGIDDLGLGSIFPFGVSNNRKPAPVTRPRTTREPPVRATSTKAALAATTSKPATTLKSSTKPRTTSKPATTSKFASSTAGGANAAYTSVALEQHNIHRRNHSAPDLAWSAALAGYAKTVADSCKFAHDLTPGGGGYGQNLAVAGSSDASLSSKDPKIYLARGITNQWYNSEFASFLPSYYGQATPDLSTFKAWGHFSQVLWKASTQVGCATSYCAPGTVFAAFGSWYTVCDYKGPGNVGGQYGENVGSPLGRPTVTAP